VLSDELFSEISVTLTERIVKGDEFYISVVTHFEIMWGYALAGMGSKNYEAFLNDLGIEIAYLSKVDVEKAANFKPSKKDVLDALIASTALRYDAKIWTFNKADFKNFLPANKLFEPKIRSASGHD
jgi:predicted nucleic acid-binding protein